MKHLENGVLFVSILYGILCFWQYIEVQIYGEIQERAVDNIITWFWIVFVILAYIKGRWDGSSK